MKLEDLKDTLVGFDCVRQTGSRVVWHSPQCQDGEHKLLDRYAFAVPEHAPIIDDRVRKRFYSDGYGGLGMFRNGGSARCGYDLTLQVKGIGVTPHLGQEVDAAHRNGKLSLHQAIYEVAWAGIIGDIAPHGCIEHVAIIDTGELMDEAYFNASDTRALLVREGVVRPAHFDRALLFQPLSHVAAQVPRDAVRVRNNIQQIERFLPVPPALSLSQWSSLLPGQRFRAGLMEYARRAAHQLAATRTRHLNLMASPSNIALDGRLLDFTSVTWLLPKLTEGARYDAAFVQMMSEHSSLLRNLDSIGFHVDKYCLHRRDQTLRSELAMAFNYHFSQALALGYLQALGFPAEVANLMLVEPTLLPLVNAYVAAIRTACSAFWEGSADVPLLTHFYWREFFAMDCPTMPPTARTYVDGCTLFALLRGLLPALQRICTQLGLAPVSVKIALIFTSYRRFALTPKLSDTAMHAGVAAVSSSASGQCDIVSSYLVSLRNEARFCFSADCSLEILLAIDADQEIHWLLDGRGLQVRRGATHLIFSDLKQLAVADPKGARLLATRYPETLLQLLDATTRKKTSTR